MPKGYLKFVYRVIANLRTGFLGLIRDFAQIEPKSDVSPLCGLGGKLNLRTSFLG